MPRISIPGFVGPTNTLRAIQADADRTVNLYTESTHPGTAKAPTWLQGTPGVRPFLGLPGAPVRCLYDINGRAFAIGGDQFCEFFYDGSVGPAFALPSSGDTTMYMVSNGQQIIINSTPLSVYDLNSDTMSQVTLPGDSRMVEFMDGYFLSLDENSRTFRWSAPEDGLTWDPLDFAERSEASDNINALIRNHREIWLVGDKTTEVWYDQGDINNTFAPLQGVFIEHGTMDFGTVQRCDNSLIWVGRDENGQAMVWRMEGYKPQRISTFAVETVLQRVQTAFNMVSFVYQMNGHIMYALVILPLTEGGTVPITTTWVYDVTMDKWHEWGIWNPAVGEYMPWVGWVHLFAFEKHFIGSRLDSTIYEMNQDFFDSEIVSI